jgi:hypothetical protein
VIVPTYNRASTIGVTLQSLIDQEFDDFEVIVIDDGSTDDTAQVVEASRLERLTYRWQPNSGPSVARNHGAEIATGEYLIFLDTGDRAHADWLLQFDKQLRDHPTDLVCGEVDFLRNDVVVGGKRPVYLGPLAGGITGSFCPGGFTISRDLFERVGGLDPELRFSEMSEFGMRVGQLLASQGEAPVLLRRPLVSVDMPQGEGRGGRTTSLAYTDANRLASAQHILAKHAEVMATAPRLRETYLRIAGVASARLGDYRLARRYFYSAWRVRPRAGKELVRACVTLLPLVRDRVWPSRG